MENSRVVLDHFLVDRIPIRRIDRAKVLELGEALLAPSPPGPLRGASYGLHVLRLVRLAPLDRAPVPSHINVHFVQHGVVAKVLLILGQ